MREPEPSKPRSPEPSYPKPPAPRGATSEALLAELRRPPHPLPPIDEPRRSDPLADEDLHVSLYLSYELHYRGLAGVHERWEWEPSLLELRGRLEQVFEDALLSAAGPPEEAVAAEEIDLVLRTTRGRRSRSGSSARPPWGRCWSSSCTARPTS